MERGRGGGVEARPTPGRGPDRVVGTAVHDSTLMGGCKPRLGGIVRRVWGVRGLGWRIYIVGVGSWEGTTRWPVSLSEKPEASRPSGWRHGELVAGGLDRAAA